MSELKQGKGYWIAGTVAALIGVAAVRLFAPELEGISKKIVMVLGYLAALGGILTLTAGFKKS